MKPQGVLRSRRPFRKVKRENRVARRFALGFHGAARRVEVVLREHRHVFFREPQGFPDFKKTFVMLLRQKRQFPVNTS